MVALWVLGKTLQPLGWLPIVAPRQKPDSAAFLWEEAWKHFSAAHQIGCNDLLQNYLECLLRIQMVVPTTYLLSQSLGENVARDFFKFSGEVMSSHFKVIIYCFNSKIEFFKMIKGLKILTIIMCMNNILLKTHF